MQTSENVPLCFWRVITMAEACDVDLSTALDENKIDITAYADMITGCQRCTQVDTCNKLLAQGPPLDQAPDYCVNKETFAKLRRA
jgi:hypothetical protein